jgi:hypothetical protein
MKHFNEAELIEYYYEEFAHMAECERHLKHCAACAESYAALRRDLGGWKAAPIPSRSEEYGEQVWQAIRNSLPVYEARKPSWLQQFWRPVSWAAACALLIACGFLAGRHWERRHQPSAVAAVDPQARQRVVVVVLGDHLDRSERLLVELNHTDQAASLEGEAKELLATNRLIRQSTGIAGDRQVEAALDHLERLLIELSNQPDGLSETRLKQLREEMNSDGLLFDLRVLRSRMRTPTSTEGASI